MVRRPEVIYRWRAREFTMTVSEIMGRKPYLMRLLRLIER